MLGQFDTEIALEHARALKQAYEDAAEGLTNIDHKGVEVNVDAWGPEHWEIDDYQRPHLRITILGTQSRRDWLNNLMFSRVRVRDYIGGQWTKTQSGRVQWGWRLQFERMWEPLYRMIQRRAFRALVFALHSLGGPVGYQATYRLAKRGWPIVAVYSYNAPRPGDRGFETSYDTQSANLPAPYDHLTLRDVTHRVTLCDPEPDTVTRIRTRRFGARHVGEPVLIYPHDEGVGVFDSVETWQEFMAEYPVDQIAAWRILSRLLAAPEGHGIQDTIDALERAREEDNAV